MNMNVYVNKDLELSLCVVSEAPLDFLCDGSNFDSDEQHCDHYELADVPQDVIDNYKNYSYVEGAFIETAIYAPTVIPLVEDAGENN